MEKSRRKKKKERQNEDPLVSSKRPYTFSGFHMVAQSRGHFDGISIMSSFSSRRL
jgi:hypothetical protein